VNKAKLIFIFFR